MDNKVDKDNPFYQEKPGLVGSISDLASKASSITDLFSKLKSLARAEDLSDAQKKLDAIAQMDKTETV
jgi:hypothetical protein|tara:strand:+ start:3648 stop:3851 length:204 start_codon:yes stop_codon:yes gene_type:complete